MIRRSLCAITALVAMATATPALAGDVIVTLTDVRPNAGDLYISLQSEDQFMQAAAVAGEKVDNPQTDTVTVTFRDVPDGRYAMSVWHDINGDGTFNMGPHGPADGWSMIGADDLRGMPTFARNSFALSGSASVTERVHYPEDSQ